MCEIEKSVSSKNSSRSKHRNRGEGGKSSNIIGKNGLKKSHLLPTHPGTFIWEGISEMLRNKVAAHFRYDFFISLTSISTSTEL